MLVLSRKRGEALVIGGNITIKIIESRGDKVRLGIEAPKEVSVHRAEVLERIKAEALQLMEGLADSTSAVEVPHAP